MNSLSLGRIFGFPVTVDPMALFFLAIVFLQRVQGGVAGLADGVIVVIVVFASVLVHELGHAFVARWYKLGQPEIVLHGFGGTTSHGRGRPGQLFWVTRAGPSAGLALGLLALPFLWVLDDGVVRDTVGYIVFVNLFWSLFNLLPMPPLDGGHLVENGLGVWIAPAKARLWAARLGLLTAIPILVFGAWNGQIFIALFAAFSLYRCGRIALA